uniref:Uncharacterized protein n=1 Tax=Oryza brachyantha TaxID=4533 RepID=J3KUD0_ORYBR
MDPTTATMTPLSSGRHRSPKAKRRRHAAPQPLGDVTNLLIPTNPTTSPLPSDSACCSMSSSLTPVSKPSSAAASEERSFVKSTISTVYTSTRRKTTEKIPFRAGTARSCPPPDTVARTNREFCVLDLCIKVKNMYLESVKLVKVPEKGLHGKPPWLRVLGLFHPQLLVIDLKRDHLAEVHM